MRVTLGLLVCFVVGLAQYSSADREGRRRHGARNTGDTTCPVRRRPCTKDCGSRGFMTTENGCEICACNPAVGCPAIECPNSGGTCPFGWQEDENGCRLCECKPNPQCAGNRPMCMMACPDGFALGDDGCPTCRCFDPTAIASQLPAATATAEAQPPVRTRPAHRHHGGDSGAAPPVPAHHAAVPSMTAVGVESNVTCPPICRMHCQYGMKLDADGCPICQCNEHPSAQPRDGRRSGRPWRQRHQQCFRPVCLMFCADGYRRDQNGCTLCECHQPGDTNFQINTGTALNCAQLRCHRFKKCAHGFATDQSSGCPSCVCRATPGV